jgi:hypothetical protein
MPEVLTQFYCSWGRRDDMTCSRDALLGTDDLSIRSGALVFALVHQAHYQWGILCELLEEEDPPVSYALWEPDDQALLWQPSHAHLSDFLDYLTYGHALSGGSPHGSATREHINEARLREIQREWTSIELASVPMGLYPDPESQWVLYGKHGIVLDPAGWIAARSRDILEEVRQHLALTWEYQW